MTDASIIGLGPMGLALARPLLEKNQRITVWNRTSAKAGPLVRDGAVLAESAASAVGASPIVIVCVHDYAATYSTLDTSEAATAFQGRVLVQLSTGTPQEARDAEAWAQKRGALYLDGAILAQPSQVGRPDTPLFLSGSKVAFQTSEPLLRIVAGSLMYMGEAVGSASAWDIATLSCMFGAMSGFFHGAHVCEAEGMRVDSLGSMIALIAPVLGQMIKDVGDAVQTETYDKPENTLKMGAEFGELIVKHAGEARLDATFPLFLAELFNRGVAAGYGGERPAAMIKVLRAGAAM